MKNTDNIGKELPPIICGLCRYETQNFEEISAHMKEHTDTPIEDNLELREQLEEFALHIKPGTTKGKHRTAIFDTVELTNLVQALLEEQKKALLDKLVGQRQNFYAKQVNNHGEVTSERLVEAVPVEKLKSLRKD